MQIGFVLFPNVTQLDFTGPLQILHRVPGATTHILARTLAPVPSDCGLGLVPTGTFAQAPALDMICVPGGFGVGAAIRDEETLAFVRAAGQSARYVTSVCTGAFLLGAAGLLRGRRATTPSSASRFRRANSRRSSQASRPATTIRCRRPARHATTANSSSCKSPAHRSASAAENLSSPCRVTW
jgi:transcriptional regulator GlxA family with amidase domain